jgi:hypothetical protein
MARLCTLLFLLALATACRAQTLGFSLADGRSRVRIPIEINSNLVVVPLVLNNQLPLKFILDTGVRTTILTEKTFSDILNLSYSRRYTISGPGGEKLVDAYVTNNVSLDLPGVRGAGHAMLVLEQDYLELRNYLGTDVHGILGYELFSRFIVQIDYEKKELMLMLPERFRPRKRFRQLPIAVQDTKPYVTATVQMTDTTRVTTKLLVDSGASHGLMLDPQSNPALIPPQKHINSIIGRGLGGIITGQIGRIKGINLGGYQIDDVIVSFPDPNSYIDSLKISRTVARNGSVGGELLSRFTIIFDFPREKFYLKSNSSIRKKFHYSLSGITVKAKGARLRKFEITDIRPGSSADIAGVQAGDSIVAVNGLPAGELDLNSINGYLNSRPGKRIVLDLERAGKKITKRFFLEDQI